MGGKGEGRGEGASGGQLKGDSRVVGMELSPWTSLFCFSWTGVQFTFFLLFCFLSVPYLKPCSVLCLKFSFKERSLSISPTHSVQETTSTPGTSSALRVCEIHTDLSLTEDFWKRKDKVLRFTCTVRAVPALISLYSASLPFCSCGCLSFLQEKR